MLYPTAHSLATPCGFCGTREGDQHSEECKKERAKMFPTAETKMQKAMSEAQKALTEAFKAGMYEHPEDYIDHARRIIVASFKPMMSNLPPLEGER